MSGTGSRAPRGLGRGLAALLGDAAPSSAGNRTVLSVIVLEPGPFQPRRGMNDEALAELAASIRQQGVLQPLLARPHPSAHGMFQIIAGERRWRAAQAAGLHEVPVLVRTLSDTEAMAAALVENLQRQDLDAIEEAEGYERLSSEFDLSQEDLAKLVGKSRSHVANCVRLLQLPPDIRAHIQTGELSAGHGRVLLGHKNAGALARTIIARGLNVRQAEALAAGPKTARTKPEPDAERRALEHDLSQALGLVVKVDFNGVGGAIRIAYTSLDQLDALIARLTR